MSRRKPRENLTSREQTAGQNHKTRAKYAAYTFFENVREVPVFENGGMYIRTSGP